MISNPKPLPKILIVDDLPLNLQILAQALSSDYQIITATNGADALNIAVQEQPELILLDVMMPGMSGFDVCRQLKSDADTREIPIIFVTALNTEVDEELGLKLGGVDFITKPYRISIIKARIHIHIQYRLLQLHMAVRTAALTKSEQALKTLSLAVEQSPSSIMITDINANIEYVNDAFTQSTGYSLEDVIGKNPRLLQSGNTPNATYEVLWSTICDGNTWRGEFVNKKKNGVEHIVATLIAPVQEQNGKTTHFVSIRDDITEKRKLEVMRLEAEQRFRIVANSAPVLIWLADTDKLCFWFNEVWLDFTGRSLEQESGNGWADCVHPDDLTRCLDIYSKYFDRREPFRMEYRLKRNDGEYRWLDDTGVPLFNAEGIFVGYIGSCVDITVTRQAQADLQASYQLLTTLTRQVPGMIYQFRLFPDGSSHFPFASEGINNIYELTAEQVKECAMPVFTILHPNDYDMVVAAIQESACTLEPWYQVYRVNLPKKGLRWLSGKANPERLEDGSTLWHGFISDITEQKELSQKLHLHRQRWKFALEGAGDGMWDWDMSTGEIIFSNRWYEIQGFENGEIGPSVKDWEELLHPDDVLMVNESLKNHFNKITESFNCEHRVRCKNGEYKWISGRGMVILWDDAGNPLRIIGTHTDITTRKLAEKNILNLNQQLAEKIHSQTHELIKSNRSLKDNIVQLNMAQQQLVLREARLHSIFNASVEGIITCDISKNITSTNTAVKAIFGYNPDNLVGWSISKLIPFVKKILIDANDITSKSSTGRIYEVHGLHQNGHAIPLDLSLAEFTVEDAKYFTFIVRDVTLRKKQEQADKEHLDQLAHITRLGLMGEMASGIAHEVNQPLTAIVNYAQASLNLINTEQPNLAKTAEVITKIYEQSLRAGQIIHRMKKFVKFNEKKTSTTLVSDLIHESIELCASEIKQNNIEVLLELENNLPPIFVDQIQIEQVLINLIRNSIDVVKDLPNEQQGQLYIQSYLDVGSSIMIKVTDNGPGLDENQQQKIFMPFYTTKSEGMGMGLSICRSLIEAHNSILKFNSAPGKGTTFYFALPIEKCDASTPFRAQG